MPNDIDLNSLLDTFNTLISDVTTNVGEMFSNMNGNLGNASSRMRNSGRQQSDFIERQYGGIKKPEGGSWSDVVNDIGSSHIGGTERNNLLESLGKMASNLDASSSSHGRSEVVETASRQGFNTTEGTTPSRYLEGLLSSVLGKKEYDFRQQSSIQQVGDLRTVFGKAMSSMAPAMKESNPEMFQMVKDMYRISSSTVDRSSFNANRQFFAAGDNFKNIVGGGVNFGNEFASGNIMKNMTDRLMTQFSDWKGGTFSRANGLTRTEEQGSQIREYLQNTMGQFKQSIESSKSIVSGFQQRVNNGETLSKDEQLQLSSHSKNIEVNERAQRKIENLAEPFGYDRNTAKFRSDGALSGMQQLAREETKRERITIPQDLQGTEKFSELRNQMHTTEAVGKLTDFDLGNNQKSDSFRKILEKIGGKNDVTNDYDFQLGQRKEFSKNLPSYIEEYNQRGDGPKISKPQAREIQKRFDEDTTQFQTQHGSKQLSSGLDLIGQLLGGRSQSGDKTNFTRELGNNLGGMDFGVQALQNIQKVFSNAQSVVDNPNGINGFMKKLQETAQNGIQSLDAAASGMKDNSPEYAANRQAKAELENVSRLMSGGNGGLFELGRYKMEPMRSSSVGYGDDASMHANRTVNEQNNMAKFVNSDYIKTFSPNQQSMISNMASRYDQHANREFDISDSISTLHSTRDKLMKDISSGSVPDRNAAMNMLNVMNQQEYGMMAHGRYGSQQKVHQMVGDETAVSSSYVYDTDHATFGNRDMIRQVSSRTKSTMGRVGAQLGDIIESSDTSIRQAGDTPIRHAGIRDTLDNASKSLIDLQKQGQLHGLDTRVGSQMYGIATQGREQLTEGYRSQRILAGEQAMSPSQKAYLGTVAPMKEEGNQMASMFGQNFQIATMFGLSSFIFQALNEAPMQASYLSTKPVLQGVGNVTGAVPMFGAMQEFSQTIPQVTDMIQTNINTITALQGSPQKAEKAVGSALEISKTQPIQFPQAMEVLTAMSVYPETKQYAGKPEFQQKAFDSVQLLSMLAPEQGTGGALFAIREMLGGQFRSLERRFNISTETVAAYGGVTDSQFKGASAERKMDILNTAMSSMFGGQEVLFRKGSQFDVQTKNMTDALTQGVVLPLVTKQNPLLSGMATGLLTKDKNGETTLSKISPETSKLLEKTVKEKADQDLDYRKNVRKEKFTPDEESAERTRLQDEHRKSIMGQTYGTPMGGLSLVATGLNNSITPILEQMNLSGKVGNFISQFGKPLINDVADFSSNYDKAKSPQEKKEVTDKYLSNLQTHIGDFAGGTSGFIRSSGLESFMGGFSDIIRKGVSSTMQSGMQIMFGSALKTAVEMPTNLIGNTLVDSSKQVMQSPLKSIGGMFTGGSDNVMSGVLNTGANTMALASLFSMREKGFGNSMAGFAGWSMIGSQVQNMPDTFNSSSVSGKMTDFASFGLGAMAITGSSGLGKNMFAGLGKNAIAPSIDAIGASLVNRFTGQNKPIDGGILLNSSKNTQLNDTIGNFSKSREDFNAAYNALPESSPLRQKFASMYEQMPTIGSIDALQGSNATRDDFRSLTPDTLKGLSDGAVKAGDEFKKTVGEANITIEEANVLKAGENLSQNANKMIKTGEEFVTPKFLSGLTKPFDYLFSNPIGDKAISTGKRMIAEGQAQSLLSETAPIQSFEEAMGFGKRVGGNVLKFGGNIANASGLGIAMSAVGAMTARVDPLTDKGEKKTTSDVLGERFDIFKGSLASNIGSVLSANYMFKGMSEGSKIISPVGKVEPGVSPSIGSAFKPELLGTIFKASAMSALVAGAGTGISHYFSTPENQRNARYSLAEGLTEATTTGVGSMVGGLAGAKMGAAWGATLGPWGSVIGMGAGALVGSGIGNSVKEMFGDNIRKFWGGKPDEKQADSNFSAYEKNMKENYTTDNNDALVDLQQLRKRMTMTVGNKNGGREIIDNFIGTAEKRQNFISSESQSMESSIMKDASNRAGKNEETFKESKTTMGLIKNSGALSPRSISEILSANNGINDAKTPAEREEAIKDRNKLVEEKVGQLNEIKKNAPKGGIAVVDDAITNLRGLTNESSNLTKSFKELQDQSLVYGAASIQKAVDNQMSEGMFSRPVQSPGDWRGMPGEGPRQWSTGEQRFKEDFNKQSERFNQDTSTQMERMEQHDAASKEHSDQNYSLSRDDLLLQRKAAQAHRPLDPVGMIDRQIAKLDYQKQWSDYERDVGKQERNEDLFKKVERHAEDSKTSFNRTTENGEYSQFIKTSRDEQQLAGRRKGLEQLKSIKDSLPVGLRKQADEVIEAEERKIQAAEMGHPVDVIKGKENVPSVKDFVRNNWDVIDDAAKRVNERKQSSSSTSSDGNVSQDENKLSKDDVDKKIDTANKKVANLKYQQAAGDTSITNDDVAKAEDERNYWVKYGGGKEKDAPTPISLSDVNKKRDEALNRIKSYSDIINAPDMGADDQSQAQMKEFARQQLPQARSELDYWNKFAKAFPGGGSSENEKPTPNAVSKAEVPKKGEDAANPDNKSVSSSNKGEGGQTTSSPSSGQQLTTNSQQSQSGQSSGNDNKGNNGAKCSDGMSGGGIGGGSFGTQLLANTALTNGFLALIARSLSGGDEQGGNNAGGRNKQPQKSLDEIIDDAYGASEQIKGRGNSDVVSDNTLSNGGVSTPQDKLNKNDVDKLNKSNQEKDSKGENKSSDKQGTSSSKESTGENEKQTPPSSDSQQNTSPKTESGNVQPKTENGGGKDYYSADKNIKKPLQPMYDKDGKPSGVFDPQTGKATMLDNLDGKKKPKMPGKPALPDVGFDTWKEPLHIPLDGPSSLGSLRPGYLPPVQEYKLESKKIPVSSAMPPGPPPITDNRKDMKFDSEKGTITDPNTGETYYNRNPKEVPEQNKNDNKKNDDSSKNKSDNSENGVVPIPNDDGKGEAVPIPNDDGKGEAVPIPNDESGSIEGKGVKQPDNNGKNDDENCRKDVQAAKKEGYEQGKNSIGEKSGSGRMNATRAMLDDQSKSISQRLNNNENNRVPSDSNSSPKTSSVSSSSSSGNNVDGKPSQSKELDDKISNNYEEMEKQNGEESENKKIDEKIASESGYSSKSESKNPNNGKQSVKGQGREKVEGSNGNIIGYTDENGNTMKPFGPSSDPKGIRDENGNLRDFKADAPIITNVPGGSPFLMNKGDTFINGKNDSFNDINVDSHKQLKGGEQSNILNKNINDLNKTQSNKLNNQQGNTSTSSERINNGLSSDPKGIRDNNGNLQDFKADLPTMINTPGGSPFWMNTGDTFMNNKGKKPLEGNVAMFGRGNTVDLFDNVPKMNHQSDDSEIFKGNKVGTFTPNGEVNYTQPTLNSFINDFNPLNVDIGKATGIFGSSLPELGDFNKKIPDINLPFQDALNNDKSPSLLEQMMNGGLSSVGEGNNFNPDDITSLVGLPSINSESPSIIPDNLSGAFGLITDGVSNVLGLNNNDDGSKSSLNNVSPASEGSFTTDVNTQAQHQLTKDKEDDKYKDANMVAQNITINQYT